MRFVRRRLDARGADRLGATDDFHPAAEARLELDGAERNDAIQAALGALPPRERLILSRSYFEERPLRQIAQELGVTESRVCQLRAQALARLRRNPGLAAVVSA